MVTAEQSICPKPYGPPRPKNPPGKSTSVIIAAHDATGSRWLLGRQQAALSCPPSRRPLTSRLGESRARLGPDPHLWALHPPQRQRFWPTGAGPAAPAEDAPLCPVGQEAWGCDGQGRAAPEGLREGGRFTSSQAWATGTYWARGANLRTGVWFGVGDDFFVETADRRNVFLTL